MAFIEKICSGFIDFNPNENEGKPTFVLFQLKYPILTTNIVSKISTFLEPQKNSSNDETTESSNYTYIPSYKQLPINCSIM